MDEQDFINDKVFSDCCSAPAWGEVEDGMGICGNCHEHATFNVLLDGEEE